MGFALQSSSFNIKLTAFRVPFLYYERLFPAFFSSLQQQASLCDPFEVTNHSILHQQ
jgi:hypothetical protein